MTPDACALLAPAAACAALLLALLWRSLRTPPAPACIEKSPLPSPSLLEKDVSDLWPAHELSSSGDPVPTIGSSLPDVPLVWGVDYSLAQPSTPAPLIAYSHIASALGVGEPELPVRPRSASLVSPSTSPSTDTRPMVSRSRSLISGIVSDWNSLSHSEQQAWASLSEARASRSRSGQSSPRPL